MSPPALAQARIARPTRPSLPTPLDDPMPTPPPPASRVSCRDRKASFALRESVDSQKKKHGRMDSELAAIAANCSAIEETDDPEPSKKAAKKAAKKKEMDKNFFKNIATGDVEIRRTSIFFCSNCQAPLTAIVSNIVNINTANINVGPGSSS